MFIDDLKKIFPEYKMEYCRNEVSITEEANTAKINKITWKNSCFQNIDNGIVKDMSSFFRKSKAPEIYRLDCDGIFLFEENSKKYLFFTELKSTFNSSEILHARNQIISSCLKINMILSMLNNYRKEDYIIKGFIASWPFNKDYIRDIYKETYTRPGSKLNEESEFVLNLCYNNKEKKITIKGSDYPEEVSPLSLKEMDLYLIEVPKGVSSIELDVHNYI